LITRLFRSKKSKEKAYSI